MAARFTEEWMDADRAGAAETASVPGVRKKKNRQREMPYTQAAKRLRQAEAARTEAAFDLYGLGDVPLDAQQGRELAERGREAVRQTERLYADYLALERERAEAQLLYNDYRMDQFQRRSQNRGDLAKERYQAEKEYAAQVQAAGDVLMKRPQVRDWGGRDDKIGEYRGLQQGLRMNSDALALGAPLPDDFPERTERLHTLHRQLEQMDAAAGNGPMAYSGQDRVGSVLVGTGMNIAADLAGTAGTVGEAYGREQLLEQTWGMDQAIRDYRWGEDRNRISREVMEAEERSHRSWKRVTDAADRLGDEAARDLERAKGDLSKLGRAGVDIAEKAIELGFDTAVGAMTGGGSTAARFRTLAPQLARTFGAAAQEARRDGADNDQQMMYGSVKGGMEVLPNVLIRITKSIPDKNTAYKTMKKAVKRLSRSQTGTVLLKALGSGAGEALQEGLKPTIKQIYQEDIPMAENSSNIDPADILYAALIGFTVGMLEGGAETAQNSLR
jgi:hypothetical protein